MDNLKNVLKELICDAVAVTALTFAAESLLKKDYEVAKMKVDFDAALYTIRILKTMLDSTGFTIGLVQKESESTIQFEIICDPPEDPANDPVENIIINVTQIPGKGCSYRYLNPDFPYGFDPNYGKFYGSKTIKEIKELINKKGE